MIKEAVSDYLSREAAANKAPQGADHKVILAEVALKYRLNIGILRSAVLDATITSPN